MNHNSQQSITFPWKPCGGKRISQNKDSNPHVTSDTTINETYQAAGVANTNIVLHTEFRSKLFYDLDLRFQYALHITSFEEQPLSDKSMTRFRRRCYDYGTTHSVDLYKDCVTDLSASPAKLMKIDGRAKKKVSRKSIVRAQVREKMKTERRRSRNRILLVRGMAKTSGKTRGRQCRTETGRVWSSFIRRLPEIPDRENPVRSFNLNTEGQRTSCLIHTSKVPQNLIS